MKAFVLDRAAGLENLELVERAVPKPAADLPRLSDVADVERSGSEPMPDYKNAFEGDMKAPHPQPT